ncbi:MAG: 16S rRNA (cytosine(1402)-N(4))-methyltransferase RsmH [Oscillospiraceae bacterium]|jgi:16S rRNA (cytosine1402-N4)-methyltransferase|nr:16S rRNA (cytosine(1402)-N(4))-methyltransferase RsmH [Oscillospiraceae bacterium]
MNAVHNPVLLEQVADLLCINPDGVYVDGTAGFGGHSAEILKKLSNGKLIMIDQDPDACKALETNFKNYKSQTSVSIVLENFVNIKDILSSFDIYSVNGILFDIGVSSFQLSDSSRGFSYRHEDAFLDMRMSKSGKSALEIINSYKKKDLEKIIFEFSQEKFAPQIAQAIVNRRKQKTIRTVGELVEIIKSAIPAKFLRNSTIHPARRTFQAIRIEVNNELEVLKDGLTAAFSLLKPGGRLCVITFHSLEDKIVKTKFQEWSNSCVCPGDFPVCVCNKKQMGNLITKKPVLPSESEVNKNPRSRSSKLRVIEAV